MWRQALLLVSVMLCAHVTLCADVYFLTAEAEYCALQGCDFNNASLWSTGVVPTSTDVVHLVAANNATDVTVEIRTNAHVGSLLSTGIHITILTGINVTVSNNTAIADALLEVHGDLYTVELELKSANASITGGLHLPTDYVGFVVIDYDSRLLVSGSYRSTAEQNIRGYVQATAQSTFEALGDVTLYNEVSDFFNEPVFGTLRILGTKASFVGGLRANDVYVATGANLYIFKSVEIQNRVWLNDLSSSLYLGNVGHVAGRNTTAFIGGNASDPIVGNGLLIIQSSNVTISSNNVPSYINSTISVFSNDTTSYINLENLILHKASTISVAPSSSVSWVLTSIEFQAPTELTGDVTFYGYNVVKQPVAVYGANSVAILDGTLKVDNTSFTSQKVTVGYGATFELDQAALAEVVDVFVEEGGQLLVGAAEGLRDDVYVPVVISGTLTSAGTVTVTQTNQLLVYGDYIQYPNATLAVTLDHPTLHPAPNTTASALWVRGATHLNSGYLKITVKIRNPDATFKILQSEGNVTGSFHTVSVDHSSVADKSIGDFDVTYENNEVVLHFKPAPDSGDKDGFWDGPWPGVIFGVGGAIILAIIIVFVVRRYRKKKQYQAIP